MIRTSAVKLTLLTVVLAVAGLSIYNIVEIDRAVSNALDVERSRLKSKNKIPFARKDLLPIASPYIRILQNSNETRSIVSFMGSYYIATGGGLFKYGLDGELERHFTILDGLPESDLLCLAVFEERLFIGTRSSGLVSFDGSKFEGYQWTDKKQFSITTLLADSEQLLIGTFGGGLVEFDGREFTGLDLKAETPVNITSIYRYGEGLFIGTFDNGLLVADGGQISNFTTANGLPSNRVVGIAQNGGELYVATDLGFGIFDGDTFTTLGALPALSGIASLDKRLYLSRENGELLTFDRSLKTLVEKHVVQNAKLEVAGNALFEVSSDGIQKAGPDGLKRFGSIDENGFSDSFVSALAFDKNDNLWVGTFRHGIDVFAADGRIRRHIESEQVREINYLAADGETVRAGTSAGLLSFTAGFAQTSSISKSDGLPSNSIMSFSAAAIATGSGLAIRDGKRLSIISTIQGLPNNSTYATLKVEDRLYVGTLGGLAEIEDMRVAQTFSDTNSGLSTNWITALCIANERLFIGTYGGGVFELMPSGEIRSFAAETGKFWVNASAMHSDGERLYVGTLDGVRVLNLITQKWSQMTIEMPSQNVLAINGNDSAVYFGTTNGIARIDKNYFDEKP